MISKHLWAMFFVWFHKNDVFDSFLELGILKIFWSVFFWPAKFEFIIIINYDFQTLNVTCVWIPNRIDLKFSGELQGIKIYYLWFRFKSKTPQNCRFSFFWTLIVIYVWMSTQINLKFSGKLDSIKIYTKNVVFYKHVVLNKSFSPSKS